MSIEPVMPFNHLILCHPLLLLPSILPSIRVFSNESVLCITWPKCWRFSISISPSDAYSGLIPLGLTGLISLQSKGLARIFSSLQSFPASGSFQMNQLFASDGQSIGVSASVSVLPMNTHDQSSEWAGWISLQSKGLSRVFSNTAVQKHQFLVLSFLYSPTLTSIHDYWKNHSSDQMDLCWQNNVSAF